MITVIITLLAVAVSCAQDPTLGTTSQAIYRGMESPYGSPIVYWFGIPYAQPPTGNLRWRPPAAITTKSSNIANAFIPNICPQSVTYGFPSSEDCLSLNIWAPINASNVPVYFFIHGGSFTTGAGIIYNGTAIVLESIKNSKPIIVVTINYRLGILGFLADQELFDEKSGPNGQSTTGNYGILDQLLALQWVKSNIAGFGGNPNDITIGGESAGAVSVDILRTSPLTPANAFQKAIVESGAIWPDAVVTLQAAYASNAASNLMKSLNCNTIACLRNATAQQIISAESVDISTNIFGAASQPCVDGYVQTDTPFNNIAKGSFAKTPLLIGSNMNETALFTCAYFNNSATTAQVEGFFNVNYGATVASKIPQVYGPISAYANPINYLNVVYSDSWNHCGSRRVAAASASNGQNTYLYTFTHVYASSSSCLGAAHAYELPSLFPTPVFDVSVIGALPNAQEQQLSSNMIAYWINFINSGNPNSDGLTTWNAYSSSADQDQVLDVQISSRSGYYKNVCSGFWDIIATNSSNISGNNNARSDSAVIRAASKLTFALILLALLLIM